MPSNKLHEDRILFLKEFTRELILNSSENPKNLALENETKKFFSEIASVFGEKIKNEESFENLNLQITENEQKPRIPVVQIPRVVPRNIFRETIRRNFVPQNNNKISSDFKLSIMSSSKSNEKNEQEIVEIDYGKLTGLIEDKKIEAIECPGAGKNILVKIRGSKNSTAIALNSNEIKSLLEQFSRQARIPLIGSTFKAYIGNILVTAVMSETGTRFILTKIDERFMIEQENKKAFAD